jgi:hypothetical protein
MFVKKILINNENMHNYIIYDRNLETNEREIRLFKFFFNKYLI